MAIKQSVKKMDQRIERIYGLRCAGMGISIFDIGKVFKVGYTAINEGVDDQVLGDRLVAFVETIRQL